MSTQTHVALRLTQTVCLLVLAALALSACTPVAAFGLNVTPTLPPAAPTIMPAVTDTPSPSPTVGATATTAPTATATKRPATPAVRATATLVTAQSVFVTAVTASPSSARSNESPQFAVTFLNTTGQTQTYRWFVKVYGADPSRSFGETTKTDSDLPANTTQLKSASDWKTQTFFDCLPFTARVFWVDGENQVHEFQKPDGSNPTTTFTVCP